MAETPIPQDVFSRTLRQLTDNPGAISSQSTIHTQDFYGNTETWVLVTFRQEDGREIVFVNRNGADGGTRFILPEEVTAALARHRDQLAVRVRRRAGHRLIALRKQRGDQLGNAAALAKARKTKSRGRR